MAVNEGSENTVNYSQEDSGSDDFINYLEDFSSSLQKDIMDMVNKQLDQSKDITDMVNKQLDQPKGGESKKVEEESPFAAQLNELRAELEKTRNEANQERIESAIVSGCQEMQLSGKMVGAYLSAYCKVELDENKKVKVNGEPLKVFLTAFANTDEGKMLSLAPKRNGLGVNRNNGSSQGGGSLSSSELFSRVFG